MKLQASIQTKKSMISVDKTANEFWTGLRRPSNRATNLNRYLPCPPPQPFYRTVLCKTAIRPLILICVCNFSFAKLIDRMMDIKVAFKLW